MQPSLTEAKGDEYLEFRCLKVRGLQEAMVNAFAIAQREGTSTNKVDLQYRLCTDIAFAREAKFESEEFIKVNSEYDREHPVDFDSISEFN